MDYSQNMLELIIFCRRPAAAGAYRRIGMENSKNYHDEQNNINTMRMREVLGTLPPFCKQFFRGIQEYTSSRTRLAYAYDLRVFFEFLHTTNSVCSRMRIEDYPLALLDQITREDIEEYMDYISYYQKDGKEYMNNERGKKRKLSALKSFYNYYFCSELIQTNPAALVPLPKQHEKEIVRLDADEVAILLDQVEDGSQLTKSQ
jgi:site-specific recombinase XerD